MRRVLVLRPEPGATFTLERAREHGLDALALPLFEIEPAPWTLPGFVRFDALLLTSANAVRHGGEALKRLRSVPVHAVGEATAEAARSAGFAVLSIGSGGVEALLGSLPPDLRLLHLCGEHRSDPAHAPQQITSIAVYRSRDKPVPEIRAAQGAVALIHSPRAAQRFSGLIDQAGLDRSSIGIAAISPAAAAAAGAGWETVEAARSPGDDALLALAERLCNKLSRA